MRISTKTLASLLLVTAVAAAVPNRSSAAKRRAKPSQFDRLLQRHDRKAELRAEILGIDPYELRTLLKKMPFDEIVCRFGFSSARDYRLALLGKLKNELRQRGWTTHKIEQYVLTRGGRLG